MRSWIIIGLEGLCDDFGYCEPYTAAEIIRKQQAAGNIQCEADIEAIANRFKCKIKWMEEADNGEED